jgi:hypothetical protein
MPVALYAGALAVSGNSIVHVGGASMNPTVTTAATYVGLINQTDRTQITWASKTPYPAGTRFRWDAAAWVNNSIIVTGGSETDVWYPSPESYKYDIATDTWMLLATKLTPVLGYNSGSFRLTDNSWVFVAASGYNSSIAISKTEIFHDDDYILPVELSSFTASAIDRDVILKWETKTEVNSAKFIVEKSIAGKNTWTESGEITAHHNSNIPVRYSFTDKELHSGKYAFRLKMIDIDGTNNYSSAIEVEVGQPKTFALSQNYPNPFNPSTKIEYKIPMDARVTIELYSITGQKIAQLVNEEQTAGYYSIEVGPSLLHKVLATGVYVYRMTASDKVKGSNFVSVKKMLMIK